MIYYGDKNYWEKKSAQIIEKCYLNKARKNACLSA